MQNIIRKTYDWVLHWAETPYGSWALFILAFCESSFFPIPPDVLLIALAISVPLKSFTYALICSLGSVLGGAFGYYIGIELMDTIGRPVLEIYGVMEKYESIGELYNQYNAWAVGIAGFTPIPYKVFTIAAGAFKIDFFVFILASFISRSARFFIVSALIFKYGSPIKTFIDKYFNLLSLIFVILLVLGFIAIKFIF